MSEHSRENKAPGVIPPRVATLLKHYDFVGEEIAHIHFTSSLDHVRVFVNKEPAHVTEEEATTGVVWILIGVGEKMMRTMIAGPMKDGPLISNAGQDHGEHFENKICVVRAMRPETVRAAGDAKTGKRPKKQAQPD